MAKNPLQDSDNLYNSVNSSDNPLQGPDMRVSGPAAAYVRGQLGYLTPDDPFAAAFGMANKAVRPQDVVASMYQHAQDNMAYEGNRALSKVSKRPSLLDLGKK